MPFEWRSVLCVPKRQPPRVPGAGPIGALFPSWSALSIAPATLFAGETKEFAAQPIFNMKRPQPVLPDRWTVFHTLFFKLQNTGLTGSPTKSSMSKVADRGIRFRFGFVQFQSGSLSWYQGIQPAFDKLEGLRGQV